MTATTRAEAVAPTGSAALRRMIDPRSVCILGASARSAWTRTVIDNLRRGGDLRLSVVNRSGADYEGIPGVATVAALDHVPDLAIVLTSAAAAEELVGQSLSHGIRSFVVLAAGFAESGPEGHARQERLAALCASHEATLIGPNTVGLVNLTSGVWATTLPVPDGLRPGALSLISQSGALSWEAMEYAAGRGIGLDVVAALGNEAVSDLATLIDAVVEAGTSTVICVYAHAIRDAPRFAGAVRRARSAGIQMVIFKVGRGEQSARAAKAHTGGLVGNDEATAAALDELGVARVESVEDLFATAVLAASHHRAGTTALAFVSGAGSSCEIIADLADRDGWALPQFAPQTIEALRAVGFSRAGGVLNPVDLTAALTVDAPERLPSVCEALLCDPGIDELVLVGQVWIEQALQDRAAFDARLEGWRAWSGKRITVWSDLPQRESVTAALADLPLIESIERGMTGAAALRRASARLRVDTPAPAAAPGPEPVDLSAIARDERASLRHLAAHGVPVIAQDYWPTGTIPTPAEFPVVLKVVAPGLLHKSEAGGVALDLADQPALEEAVATMREHVERATGAEVDGFVTSPMRRGGVELLVSVLRDPQWGPLMTVGLGGSLVEILKDVAVRRLPITDADAEEMLGDLRTQELLDGYRGAPAVDRTAVARAAVAAARAFAALGETAFALEINPLWVEGSRVEAWDAVIELHHPGRGEERA